MVKKKIKDLTLKEANNICQKHKCDNCPLNDNKSSCSLAGIDNKKLPRRYLKKKVEVEENE